MNGDLQIRYLTALLFSLALAGAVLAEPDIDLHFSGEHVYLRNAEELLLNQQAPTTPESLALELVRLTNEARIQHGLEPLTLHPALHGAAKLHAMEMSSLNYFSHTSPTPGRSSTRQRVQLFGANPVKVAENIFECSGYDLSLAPRFAAEAFVWSPRHRQNLLDPSASHLGIGFAEHDGRVSISQVFGSGF